jgi:flavin-dependent dehydrogenase
VPLRRAKMAIQRGNALLLGDAAGLVHSLSGEGIYYAIKSAQLAAPVIAEALRAESINLYDYEQAANRELMPGLRRGRALSRLHHWSPHLYIYMLKRSERLWRVVCCLLRDEESQIKQELGPALPLFKLLHLGLKGVGNALSWGGIR